MLSIPVPRPVGSHQKVFKSQSHRMMFLMRNNIVAGLGVVKPRKWSKHEPSWNVSTPTACGLKCLLYEQTKQANR